MSIKTEEKSNNPLVSVIIPIYNTEKYFPQCMETIFAQTYTNLDIVLIDDGSKDGSSALCDSYATRDVRVQVCHKPNGGLVSAWMAGVKLAKGEYLVFVDSDDWIELDMVKQLVKHIQGDYKEIICSNYIIEKEKQQTKVKQGMTPGVYIKKQIEEQILSEIFGHEIRKIHCSRCMKLISKSLILDNLSYCDPQVTMGEDLNIMFPVFLDAERIVIVEEGYYYHYRLVTASMAHQYDEKLYGQLELLYHAIVNVIQGKISVSEKDFWLQKWKEEFTILMLLVIKNEIRGGRNQVKNRICKVLADAKLKGYFADTEIPICSKNNAILYAILKNPNRRNIWFGTIALRVFDKIQLIKNK